MALTRRPLLEPPSSEIPLLCFDHIAGETETLRRAGQDGFAVAPAGRNFILAPQRRGLNEILHLGEGLIGWFGADGEGDPEDRWDAKDLMGSTR